MAISGVDLFVKMRVIGDSSSCVYAYMRLDTKSPPPHPLDPPHPWDIPSVCGKLCKVHCKICFGKTKVCVLWIIFHVIDCYRQDWRSCVVSRDRLAVHSSFKQSHSSKLSVWIYSEVDSLLWRSYTVSRDRLAFRSSLKQSRSSAEYLPIVMKADLRKNLTGYIEIKNTSAQVPPSAIFGQTARKLWMPIL